jgi:crotonobetainyl-CoA:carnitine CoA-transferase CaiB-like acyl-CoA transferase
VRPGSPSVAGVDLPLDGIRVIDMTSVIMGPLATQVLADLGADVIVIEDRRGDTNRSMGRGGHPELSGTATNLLRNKRSVGLDVRAEAGHAALARLVASADVFVTNLRPGSRRRARLTYDDLRPFRPDLVYVAASGYPLDGERADDPAYDDVVQAGAGLADLARRVGLPPTIAPTLVADKTAGLVIANAVTAGLFRRERTGAGCEQFIAMSEVMRAYVLVEHGAQAIPEPPLGEPGYTRVLNPNRRPQPTADGYVHALPYDAEQFRVVFELGGRPELADERIATRASRIEHGESLYGDLAEVMLTRTTAEWVELLRARGVPVTELGTLDDLLADLPLAEHPHAGTYRVTPSLTGGAPDPAVVRRPAPLHGEHGRDVLAEVGFTAAELDSLEGAGVLYAGPC